MFMSKELTHAIRMDLQTDEMHSGQVHLIYTGMLDWHLNPKYDADLIAYNWSIMLPVGHCGFLHKRSIGPQSG